MLRRARCRAPRHRTDWWLPGCCTARAKLQDLWWRWRKGREPAGFLILRQCSAIAGFFVPGKRLVQRLAPVEAGVERLDEQLCIAEGIADTGGREGIFVIAGIADQRPARTVRLAEEVGQIAGPEKAFCASPPAYTLRELEGTIQAFKKAGFDVGANRGELVGWPLHADAY